MSAAEREPFEGWAIVELMGHRRLAGQVSEQTIAGAAFLRIDVPEHCDTCPHEWSQHTAGGMCGGNGSVCHCIRIADPTAVAATQFYAPAAVYAITPTSEDTARVAARNWRPTPVSLWELARLPAGPEPDLDEDEFS